ncbi:ankyrin repeat domain-containing protein [Candidatus Berkiella aquae]|uniref:Ankyrin repeat domain-containing protein n=1 Tax=Candidatus Berkiella aquae TaxID=295108 RepID=A0A0Q9YPN2_9GAMM|nr:ankyrin repeat domain-containing protein [Candidatus Berkiella aquae]MCS5711866.1 ankyrin repeat domain-containing protein [Candidatus Berkiella aquae]
MLAPNFGVDYRIADKTIEVQDILIQGQAGETSLSKYKAYNNTRPLYLADATVPPDPQRIDRICATIRSWLITAMQKHKTINPDLITRLITDEFSFYTKDRPLSIDEYCQIIQNIKNLFMHPIIPPNTYVPPNIHLMLATFPVLGNDNKVHNSALYIQSPVDGNYNHIPMINHFEKENASLVDFQYGYINNAGQKIVYPLIGDSPATDVLLSEQQDAAKKLSNAGVLMNDPNQYQSALKIITNTGGTFLTTTGICLDHAKGVCKKNLHKLIDKLSSNNAPIPLKVSHIISSFSINEFSENMAATAIHVDPKVGKGYMGIGGKDKIHPADYGHFSASFGAKGKYFQSYAPKAIGLAKEHQLDHIASKTPDRIPARLNLQDAQGNTILHRALLEHQHDFDNTFARLAKYTQLGAKIDIKNLNNQSILDLVLLAMKDQNQISLIDPILHHPDLKKPNFFGNGENLSSYIVAFLQKWQPKLIQPLISHIKNESSLIVKKAILETQNANMSLDTRIGTLSKALCLAMNVNEIQLADIQFAIDNDCFLALETIIDFNPAFLNVSLAPGKTSLAGVLKGKLLLAIDNDNAIETYWLARILHKNHQLNFPCNNKGENPLHLAAVKSKAQAIESLIQVNPDLLFTRDSQGNTPLKKCENILLQILQRAINADNFSETKKLAEIVKRGGVAFPSSAAGNYLHQALLYNKGNAAVALTQTFPHLLSEKNSRGEYPLDTLNRNHIYYTAPDKKSYLFADFVAQSFPHLLIYRTPVNAPAKAAPIVHHFANNAPNVPVLNPLPANPPVLNPLPGNPPVSDFDNGIFKLMDTKQIPYTIGHSGKATIIYFEGPDGNKNADIFSKSAYHTLGLGSLAAAKQGRSQPKTVQIDNKSQKYCIYLTTQDCQTISNYSYSNKKPKMS